MTKSFVEIPAISRQQALKEMLELKNVVDEEQRRAQARKNPLFGLGFE